MHLLKQRRLSARERRCSMAVDMGNTPATSGGFMGFVQSHPGLDIAGLILLLVLAGAYFKNKSAATTASNAPLTNATGLTNGTIYRPTQTIFSNIYKGASSGNTTTTTTSTSTTNTATTGGKIINGATGGTTTPTTPPVHNPPPPQPKPKPTSKSLIWDQRYTIRGGETLSSIATSVTRTCRAQGMPGSQSVTWGDLYSHNTATINAESAAHHNPIPGGPWNDIFPGETITVPRWG